MKRENRFTIRYIRNDAMTPRQARETAVIVQKKINAVRTAVGAYAMFSKGISELSRSRDEALYYVKTLRNRRKELLNTGGYYVVERRFFGENLHGFIYKPGQKEKAKALCEIRQAIQERRARMKHVRDPLAARQPGELFATFMSKRLERNKHPYDGERYIGIELETAMPSGYNRDTFLPFGKWMNIGSDGSIETNGRENGVEFRICMKLSEMREVLPGIVKAIVDEGGRVNTSCGMHVHLDQRAKPNVALTFQKLVRSLALLYTVVPKSRQNNTYCQRNRHSNFASAANGERYKAVNATAYYKHNTLEVRLFGGTLDAVKIMNWVEVLHGIADGETVLRCPRTFDDAAKLWKISDENLTWLKARAAKFGHVVSESDTEELSVAAAERIELAESDDSDDETCDECGSSSHDTSDCEERSLAEAV